MRGFVPLSCSFIRSWWSVFVALYPSLDRILRFYLSSVPFRYFTMPAKRTKAGAKGAKAAKVPVTPAAVHTRQSVIRMTYNWCLCCLRFAVSDFDPQGTSPLFVECDFGRASHLCDLCHKRRGLCHVPFEGMSGDARDLTNVMKWCKAQFWLYEGANTTMPDWDDDCKIAIRVALKDLFDAFARAHTAHRSAHTPHRCDNWETVCFQCFFV